MPNADEIARAVADGEVCPQDLNPLARALWLAKAGEWELAHELCQDLPDPGGAWIHAWLHREEGDYGNACYWYFRAGKEGVPEKASLEGEWFQIARELLG